MNRIAEKYKSEKIGNHWNVDDTKSSFNNLINHLCITTNIYQFFSQAISNKLLFRNTKDLVVADLGAGIGWTSAILAKDTRIKNYPDVATFSFFCRKGNILQLKNTFMKSKSLALGRGIVFHIAPSNLPVNFAFVPGVDGSGSRFSILLGFNMNK